MNPTTVLTIFVALTAAAVTLQMIILYALYRAVSSSAAKVESLASQMEQKALPVLDSAATILEDAQPKISELTANLAETSGIIRERVEHMSLATGEVIERARLQAARLDELVTTTAEKIEHTTDFLQNTVFAPIRRIQAIIQAISAGLNFFRRSRQPSRVHRVPEEEDEEMFI